MKKKYQSHKFKKFNKKKAKKGVLQKHIRRNKKYTGKQYKSSEENKRRGSKPTKIIAPKVFSVIKNPNETLLFFKSLKSKLKKTSRVFIDHSQTIEITPESIILLLSQFDYYVTLFRSIDILGNLPKSNSARLIFEASGFDKFVSMKSTVNKRSNFFEVRQGTGVEPEVADEVVQFALKKLNLNESLHSRKTYGTIIECMANTKNHAYKNDSKYSKWYLISYYDKVKRSVIFAFVDIGSGIPKTIKKKLLENFTHSDAELIFEATRGGFKNMRTRTSRPYRGKGLPKIHSNLKSNFFSNLWIVSNNGSLSMSNLTKDLTNLDYKLKGTVLSWEFSGDQGE